MRFILSALLLVSPCFLHAEENTSKTTEWQLKKITLGSGTVMKGFVLQRGGTVLIDDGSGPLDFTGVVKVEDLPDEEKITLRDEFTKRRDYIANKKVTRGSEHATSATKSSAEEPKGNALESAKDTIKAVLKEGEVQRKAKLNQYKRAMANLPMVSQVVPNGARHTKTVFVRTDEYYRLASEVAMLEDAKGKFLPKLDLVEGSIGLICNELQRNNAGEVSYVSKAAKIWPRPAEC